jgi:hypothetical protein
MASTLANRYREMSKYIEFYVKMWKVLVIPLLGTARDSTYKVLLEDNQNCHNMVQRTNTTQPPKKTGTTIAQFKGSSKRVQRATKQMYALLIIIFIK